MMNNADKPAYPNRISSKLNGNVMNYEIEFGLTKREKIAAMAMQGLLGTEYLNHKFRGNEFKQEGVPRQAVELADALLRELENTEEQ